MGSCAVSPARRLFALIRPSSWHSCVLPSTSSTPCHPSHAIPPHYPNPRVQELTYETEGTNLGSESGRGLHK
jgi:hypothetical protein